MTRLTVIADTGFLVGLLNEQDRWHGFAKSKAADLPVPYVTCEAVVSESCFLLRDGRGGERRVLAMLEKSVLRIDFFLNEEVSSTTSLMKKYESVPMSLADACLVRMSETIENSVVFTVDSDFLIYRKNGKRAIPLIYPAR